MAKQALKQQTTRVDTPEGKALKNEALITYDDNVLPTPQELEAYKQVDPKIVDFLIESAKAEQAFRHGFCFLGVAGVSWSQCFCSLFESSLVCRNIGIRNHHCYSFDFCQEG